MKIKNFLIKVNSFLGKIDLILTMGKYNKASFLSLVYNIISFSIYAISEAVKKKTIILTHSKIKNKNGIPLDYDGIIGEYDKKESKIGKAVLKKPDELEIGKIYLHGIEEDDGLYAEIPAVSLIKKCESFDPSYILLYLPNEKAYGTWDCDHLVLTIFYKTNWDKIKKNPLLYLNSQWSDIEEEEKMIEYRYLEGYELKEVEF